VNETRKKFPKVKEKFELKTRLQIEIALAYHTSNMRSLTEQQKTALATKLGWSLDFFNGYAEGVKWAYEYMSWMLGVKQVA